MNLESIKATIYVRLFAIFKVPLFAFTNPSIIEFTDKRVELKIPLGFRTKNHLGVMYFGALNIGGEAAAGVLAFRKIHESGLRIDFLFKDFSGRYLKRADGDVHFICEEADKVVELIQLAASSTERQNAKIHTYAIVPTKHPSDRVAEFELTLSVKKRS